MPPVLATPSGYADIFDQRANRYHLAMRTLPQARHHEFATLFKHIPLTEHDSIIDIPSGGGYLQAHIEVPCRIDSHDFSSGFAEAGGTDIRQIDPQADEWPIGRASRVVSLAGLHHFADPVAAIARLYRHTLPGGVLHIADVAADSAPGALLNGFVHRYNPQGHQGNFLPTKRDAWPADWQIARLREEAIPWQFPTPDAMAWFCCQLFGVPLNLAPAMREELARTIGYDSTPEGCQLHWSLLYLDVVRPS